MKKTLLLFILTLFAATILTGCATVKNIIDPLPDEYTEGLRLSRDFPEDDIELYYDAVIFKQDESEDEISLNYGVLDELDEVIGFYDDILTDNGLTVEESDDSRNEYYAKGIGSGYKFEIYASLAEGGYEQRAFSTVVEITIEFYTVGEETLKKIQGFWLVCGQNGEIDDSYRELGDAMEFNDMTIDFYNDFDADALNTDFVFLDDDTIYLEKDGEQFTLDISFEIINNIEYLSLYMEEYNETLLLEKSNYDMMLWYEILTPPEDTPSSEETAPESELADREIENFIYGWVWYYTGYLYADGSFEANTEQNEIFYFDVDYTGYYQFEDSISYISWYVEDGYLYVTFEDEGTYYWQVDCEQTADELYLYLADYSASDGSAYVYSINMPDIAANTIPYDYDLTDAEIEMLVADKTWYIAGYMHTDGTYEERSNWTMYLDSSDYTGFREIDGTTENLSWYITDGRLYLSIGETSYYRPLDYEYDGTYEYMYLFNMTEGEEGAFYIFISTNE